MNNLEWEQLFILLLKASNFPTSDFLDRLAVRSSEEEYVKVREYLDALVEDEA